jgi:hypothetical protein
MHTGSGAIRDVGPVFSASWSDSMELSSAAEGSRRGQHAKAGDRSETAARLECETAFERQPVCL